MRKLFLILWISIIITITINYASADIVDPSSFNTSTRETSNGKMIELLYSDYQQWLSSYKQLLVENISQQQTIKQWEDNYQQLLDDTVWTDSYDELLTQYRYVDKQYNNAVTWNQRYKTGLLITGLIIILETTIIILQ